MLIRNYIDLEYMYLVLVWIILKFCILEAISYYVLLVCVDTEYF